MAQQDHIEREREHKSLAIERLQDPLAVDKGPKTSELQEHSGVSRGQRAIGNLRTSRRDYSKA